MDDAISYSVKMNIDENIRKLIDIYGFIMETSNKTRSDFVTQGSKRGYYYSKRRSTRKKGTANDNFSCFGFPRTRRHLHHGRCSSKDTMFTKEVLGWPQLSNKGFLL